MATVSALRSIAKGLMFLLISTEDKRTLPDLLLGTQQ